MHSTYGFGCIAPPFALKPTLQLSELMLAPVLASGVAHPEETFWQPGRYRLTGHYTGRLIDLAAWYETYYGKPAGEGACGTRVPEFIVTGWCYADAPDTKNPTTHTKYVCKK
ncbi:MAG TPA: hypothetical protein VM925_08620 [Labilithrix sp.]|nr:hypothetical protein [Labilithrix sp.]